MKASDQAAPIAGEYLTGGAPEAPAASSVTTGAGHGAGRPVPDSQNPPDNSQKKPGEYRVSP